jgi:hypothetical protein
MLPYSALPIPKSWANPRVYCVVATNINIYPGGGGVHTANILIRFHAKNNLKKGVRRKSGLRKIHSRLKNV